MSQQSPPRSPQRSAQRQSGEVAIKLYPKYSKEVKYQPVTKQPPEYEGEQHATQQPAHNIQPSAPGMYGQPLMQQPPVQGMYGQPQIQQPPAPGMYGQPQTQQPPVPVMYGQSQTQQPPIPGMYAQPQMQQPTVPGMYAQPLIQQPTVSGMYGGQPQMQQPTAQPAALVQWMNRPPGGADCPPGLEYLTTVDQLLVKQEIELLELLTKWESSNKYRILNTVNQQVYYAAEESDPYNRQLAGHLRGFVIHLTDNTGAEVLRIRREYKCCSGCCWCAGSDHCALEVAVEDCTGRKLGYVRQGFSCCSSSFDIMDAKRKLVGHIDGPACCRCNPYSDYKFPAFSPSGTELGTITKQWSGFKKEYLTDADNFSITFPLDMDVRTKATMMGALFLVDFMFFEQVPDQRRHR